MSKTSVLVLAAVASAVVSLASPVFAQTADTTDATQDLKAQVQEFQAQASDFQAQDFEAQDFETQGPASADAVESYVPAVTHSNFGGHGGSH